MIDGTNPLQKAFTKLNDRVFSVDHRRHDSTNITAIKRQEYVEYNNRMIYKHHGNSMPLTEPFESNLMLNSSTSLMHYNYVNDQAGCARVNGYNNMNKPVYMGEEYNYNGASNPPINDCNMQQIGNIIPNIMRNGTRLSPDVHRQYNSIQPLGNVANYVNENIKLQNDIYMNMLNANMGDAIQNRDFSHAIPAKNHIQAKPITDAKLVKIADTPGETESLDDKNAAKELSNILTSKRKKERKPHISSGKPTHQYSPKYSDPVEKELEKWHNSHNSTLHWERVKRGVYSVDGLIVRLVKVNGNLYVEGHGFKKKSEQLHILNFVEEKQFRHQV